MKCPKCSAPAPEGALECPGCGVIFAKLAKQRERAELEAKAAAALMDAPPAPAAVSHKARYAAIAFVAVWMVILAAAVHRSMGKSRGGPAARPQVVRIQDPETGEYRELPVVEASPRQADPSKPAKTPPRPSSWESGWIEENGKKRK